MDKPPIPPYIALRGMVFCSTLLAMVSASVAFDANWFLMVVNAFASSYSFGAFLCSKMYHNKDVPVEVLLMVPDILMGVVLAACGQSAVWSVGGIITYSIILTFLASFVFILCLVPAGIVSVAYKSL